MQEQITNIALAHGATSVSFASNGKDLTVFFEGDTAGRQYDMREALGDMIDQDQFDFDRNAHGTFVYLEAA